MVEMAHQKSPHVGLRVLLAVVHRKWHTKRTCVGLRVVGLFTLVLLAVVHSVSNACHAPKSSKSFLNHETSTSIQVVERGVLRSKWSDLGDLLEYLPPSEGKNLHWERHLMMSVCQYGYGFEYWSRRMPLSNQGYK
jgi:hypothetical protein